MKKINENIHLVVIAVIIAIGLLAGAFVISNTGFSIRNLGTTDSTGRVLNSISANGDGKVYATPDMAVITFSFSETAATSKEALENVNTKINSALDMLTLAGIDASDITTTQLSIYTEYDWSSSERKVIGQTASSGLEVKVKGIDAKATKVTTIIDQLAEIEKIQFSGITFDIEDKSNYFTEARDLAFSKAKQKAVELASLSGVKLLTPITITDNSYDSYYNSTPMLNYALDKAAGTAESSTALATGELEISVSLSISWGME